jgi:type II secretory pathway component GspD/PulD (secretin)
MPDCALNRALERRRRPAAASSRIAIFLWVAAAFGACTSPSNGETPTRKGEAGVDEIRELMKQADVKPVEPLPASDPAPKVDPSMDDGAFERAESAVQFSEPKSNPVVAATDAPPAATAPPTELPTAPATAPPTAPASDPPTAASSTEAAATPSLTGGSGEIQFQENPYLVFGKRIQVYPQSGLIMKPYPLRVGTGIRIENLIRTYGNFALWESGPQRPDQVRVQLVEKWDQETFNDLRQVVLDAGKPLDVADWLIIVAGPELLKEVESFLNIFAAGVPQIEIEAKIVEVTLTEGLDWGVRPIDAGTPIFGFPDHTLVKSLNYALPNGQGLSPNSFLQLGAVQDGLRFNAVLEALAGFENVSIISRPKIAVREGGKAEIVNTLKIPTYAISGITADGKFGATLNYEEVGIKLYVVPRVVGTQTVALNIDVEASAQSGTSVTFAVEGGTTLSNPIIAKRAAKTVVYLEPGQAVIMGGLITERRVETESKVPLLGDIPILGYLFKSSRLRKEQTNVLFFIRPRILQGSDLNREF